MSRLDSWKEKTIFGEKIVEIAKSMIGKTAKRYIGPDDGLDEVSGYDCSGFILQVLRRANIPVFRYEDQNGVLRPIRHSNELFDHFGVFIPEDRISAGDLIFFSWDGTRPQHVGIVIDRDHFVHADTRNLQVSKSKIRRVRIKKSEKDSIYQFNPVGFKRPTVPFSDSRKRYFQRPI